MEKEIKKFLEFNGKNIYFLAVDGIYWIAVKPICEALDVDEQFQQTFIHELQDEIDQLYDARRMVAIQKGGEELSQPGGKHTPVEPSKREKIVSEQTMLAADSKMRKMLCISEEYVYGWIFQIQSPNNTELLKYKLKCYQLLYDYFHGAITERSNILKEKTQVDFEIEKLEKKLQNSEDYKRIQELKAQKKKATTKLKLLDSNMVGTQLELWKQEFEMK
jgi:hypothetical protein